MDADRIGKLEGRELDAAVAEARGWVWVDSGVGIIGMPHYRDVNGMAWIFPDGYYPSGSITAAIPLLFEMMADPQSLVSFCNGDGDSYDLDAYMARGWVHMSVDTEAEVPAMICRAWLQWKETTGD